MLPYSSEVLFAIFGQFSRTTWPAPLLFCVLALVMGGLLVRASAGGPARVVHALLAVTWAWTGIGFHLVHFAPLNFAAPVYGGAFVVQALLFAWAGASGRPRYRGAREAGSWVGWLLLAYALFAYPLVDAWLGAGWRNVRLFGMAPGPTLLFTLGVLWFAEGRRAYYLLIIPVLWSLVAGLSAWALDMPQDLLLPVAGIAAAASAVARQRRR